MHVQAAGGSAAEQSAIRLILKTLLFFNHSDFWGGAEANLFQIANALTPEYRIIIVGPSNAPLKRQCEGNRIEYHDVSLASFRVPLLKVISRLIKFITDIHRLCKTVRPDILISNSSRCNLYATLFYFYRPRCAQIWILNEYQVSRAHLRLFGWIPERYVAVSEAICHFYGKPNTSIIPNAFPVAELKRASTTLEQSKPFRVGFFGRFVRLKGIQVLIKSIHILKTRSLCVTAVLFGERSQKEPEYFDEIRKLVSDLDLESSVEFRGFTNSVMAEISRCSILVSPTVSEYGGPESFGRTIVEAMIAGVPVIATNCGGAAEIIEHGITGLLVAENDAVALADAIGILYSKPEKAQELASNAKILVDQFDVSIVAIAYRAVFEGVDESK